MRDKKAGTCGLYLFGVYISDNYNTLLQVTTLGGKYVEDTAILMAFSMIFTLLEISHPPCPRALVFTPKNDFKVSIHPKLDHLVFGIYRWI